MPQEQFGGTAGRGTDAANMCVRTFINWCNDHKSSFYVLFVDLVKAFDQVVRELVMGIPADCTDPAMFLEELGLNERQREFVVAFCGEHGSLLEKWGVAKRIVLVLQQLHRGAWFCYEQCDSVVLTSRGGRQGCKFGSKVFNTAYALGMQLIFEQLSARGVPIEFVADPSVFCGDAPRPGEANWRGSPCQIAFVDDLCLMISAASPSLMDQAIRATNATLVETAQLLKFEINFKVGKPRQCSGTEARGRRRGRGNGDKTTDPLPYGLRTRATRTLLRCSSTLSTDTSTSAASS